MTQGLIMCYRAYESSDGFACWPFHIDFGNDEYVKHFIGLPRRGISRSTLTKQCR
jgi:hypothetical protein